jgi:tetratricopeptide (TPR) repeat protein
MKGLRHKVIILILLSTSLQLNASYRSEIYFAYIHNRMDLWKNVIVQMDAIPDKSNELLLELVNYQYGYIGYCIKFDKKEEAKKHLVLAQRNVEILEKRKNKSSALGGSKKEALENYLKAKDIVEKDPEFISGNWNYMSLLVVIGQTYTYLKDYASAQKVYDNILKIEPGFLYVKDDLYPKLLKKMEN